MKGREAKGSETLFSLRNSLYIFFLSFLSIILGQQDQIGLGRKKKKKHGKKDQLIFTVSLFYFFSLFLQNFLSFFVFFFFVFVLKICVCIYFLVGFNLWLFANMGLLGFIKKGDLVPFWVFSADIRNRDGSGWERQTKRGERRETSFWH